MEDLESYIAAKGFPNGSTFATSGNNFNGGDGYHWAGGWGENPLTFIRWLPGVEKPLDDSFLSLQLVNSSLYMVQSEGLDDYYICEYKPTLRQFYLKRQTLSLIILMVAISRCTPPFVEIGDRCFFFSSNKIPTYEYYKMTYKNRVFSVPVIMDWLAANFGCETIDAKARLMTVRSWEEMKLIAEYMRYKAHAQTHAVFWCGGHRGRLADINDIDHSTLVDFYWHQDTQPINYTHFEVKSPKKEPNRGRYCVKLEFLGTKLEMSVESCHKKIAFVCELN
ncbi:hypothetical protein KR009_006277, partial [Drosophila setifemur]